MTRRIAAGLAAAVVIAVGGWALAQQATPGKGQPAAAPPAAGAAGPVLEAGKRYTFYWERGEITNAVAVEALRGGWIRVRSRLESGMETVQWVNLGTVNYVVELPAGK